MAISRHFDKSIIIRRLRSVSGGQRFSSTATVDGHIQELDQRSRLEIGIVATKAWIAWFPEDAIVQEGDELVGPDGTQYYTNEVVTKDYGGAINRHKQVILTLKNG